MKKKINELLFRLKNAADKFATVAHTAVSQGILTWEQHENLMKIYRKMMREIAKLEKELTQGEDNNEY